MDAIARPPVDRLLAALFPPPPEGGGPAPSVYAVLDGARDERHDHQDEHCGRACEPARDAAPSVRS